MRPSLVVSGLTINSFDLESLFDYIMIYDGDNAAAPVIGMLSGTTPSTTVFVSSGPSMYVGLYADSGTFGAGVDFDYVVVSSAATTTLGPFRHCGTEITAASGTIGVPAVGHEYYPPFLECIVTLTVPSGAVELSFPLFSIEADFDLLRVFDGPTIQSDMIGAWSATPPPASVKASQASVTLYFMSDYETFDLGFQVSWSSGAGAAAPTPACAGLTTVTSTGVSIESHTPYTGNYAPYSHCAWHLTSVDATKLVSITFSTFVTLDDTDYVYFYDGPDDKSPLTIRSLSGPYLYIVFDADDFGQFAGFTGSWSLVPASPAPPAPPPDGPNCVGHQRITVPPGGSGTISMPDPITSANYALNLLCSWTLVAASGTIRITYTIHDLGGGDYCSIKDGERLNSVPQVTTISSSVPFVFETTGSTATIDFVSDSGGSSDGFVFNYDNILPPAPPPPPNPPPPTPKVITPRVVSAAPSLSPLAGGVVFTLTGTGFDAGLTAVLATATSPTLAVNVSDDGQQLTFLAPPHPVAEYVALEMVHPTGGKGVTDVFYTDDCPEPGWFGVGASCRPCPAGGICPGGNRVWPQPGFWTPDEGAGYVIECKPPSERCAGGRQSSCGPEYAGRECAQCAPEHYRDGTLCVSCPPSKAVLVALIMANVIFYSLVLLAMLTLSDKHLGVAVSVLEVAQFVRGSQQVASVATAEPLATVYRLLALSAMDAESFLQPGCSIASSFVVRFWASVSIGYGTMVAMLVAILALRLALAMWGFTGLAEFYKHRIFRAATILFSLLYLVAASSSFAGVFCTADNEGVWRLVAEPELVCWSADHMPIFLVSLVIMLVHTLVGVVAVFVWLGRFSSALDAAYLPATSALVKASWTRTDFVIRYGQFFEAYVVWWGGALHYLFLLSLASTSVFAQKHNLAQLGVSLGASVIYLAAIIIWHPFRQRWREALVVAFLVLASAIQVSSYLISEKPSLRPPVSYSLMGIFAMAVILLGAFFYTLRRKARARVGPTKDDPSVLASATTSNASNTFTTVVEVFDPPSSSASASTTLSSSSSTSSTRTSCRGNTVTSTTEVTPVVRFELDGGLAVSSDDDELVDVGVVSAARLALPAAARTKASLKTMRHSQSAVSPREIGGLRNLNNFRNMRHVESMKVPPSRQATRSVSAPDRDGRGRQTSASRDRAAR
ncbi:uncharacterized protein AMSG_12270 [Thecamonas trahens ATCC 50062]|uniref:CUB domain-containing protein n=1 Tax=Thecamonas trahens ATCC 50062 TaxID=461836 RepID=A0A0L0DP48_THETB|nr:hypothetical protein AMSG_12270 [Thecamonas trahens ATCC 50062]KNC53811.1 hypothetical protein AMSG_12270 [Thecamonas trahens ATCC 50062]|eukprot:XP_013754383.1 hypothetical protein AMSG_12270 [Thecamonas trahens ATCC 50062]